MELKVGDIVRYRGKKVRVLQCDSIEIKLSEFGCCKKNDQEIELVESVKLHQFRDGDFAIVNDIPKSEQNSYGTIWMSEMDRYINQIVQVHNPRKSQHLGDLVNINGWAFHTYHLEPVCDYDIV